MTDTEKREIIAEVLKEIKVSSTGVENLSEVTDLSTISSIPCLQGVTVVKVLVKTLQQPALDAAEIANKATTDSQNQTALAKTATDNANTATSNANTAVTNANAAAKTATDAAAAMSTVLCTLVNVNILLDVDTQYADIVGAVQAVQASGNKSVQKNGVVFIYKTAKGWKCKQFTGDASDDTVFATASNWKDFGGGGSGAGFYNVTTQIPLSTGYYTLNTAVAAVAAVGLEDDQKKGMVITFEEAAGKWVNYRFIGSDVSTFADVTSWKLYIEDTYVRTISVVKGTTTTKTSPDSDGNVTIEVPVVNIDETLSQSSTNPVQNKAVYARFNDFDTKYGQVVKLITNTSGTETKYKIGLYAINSQSEEVPLSETEEFSAGGGSGPTTATQIKLTRTGTSSTIIKTGLSAVIKMTYDQVYTASGESTGATGVATIRISHGSNYDTLTQSIPAGTMMGGLNGVDITKYLVTGTNNVRVTVTVTDDTGSTQTNSMSWTFTCVELVLSTTYNLAKEIYIGDTVSIPYSLTGEGNKTVYCYDGTGVNVITSFPANESSMSGAISIQTTGYTHGAHPIQLVMKDANGISSNSIYLDLIVRDKNSDVPIVGMRFDYPDGSIIKSGDSQLPYIPVTQFNNYSFSYAAYKRNTTPVTVVVYEGSNVISTASVPFTTNTVSVKESSSGTIACKIVCGATTYNYNVVSTGTPLNISEPSGYTLKLDPTSKSNSDTDRDSWKNLGSESKVTCTFAGFKWGGDGWLNGALKLTDDARLTINYNPLKSTTAHNDSGFAYVLKYQVSNVRDSDAVVLSCVDSKGTGFVITATQIKMVTSAGSTVLMKMASDITYEIAFVSFPDLSSSTNEYEKENTLMLSLYINGILSGSIQRGGSTDTIYQEDTESIPITAGSSSADLSIYLMRCYTNYLSDSQILNCYIIDQDSITKMNELYYKNDILVGGEVSVSGVPDDLGYFIITGTTGDIATVEYAQIQNSKSAKYDLDSIMYINRSKPEKNFIVKNGCCISLQGTSSLAYPMKNFRIYTYNKAKVAGELYLGCDENGENGTRATNSDGSYTNNYSFRDANTDTGVKAAAAVNCFCLKADYAESSSSHNTGLAKLVNSALVKEGILTPAQEHISENTFDIRTTVDGFPCLIFYRKSATDTDIKFLGKYNFNNDKSTEAVFGFKGVTGYHDADWKNNFITEPYGSDMNNSNPTQCWEFLTNESEFGNYKRCDFTTFRSDNLYPLWMDSFEARYPNNDKINTLYKSKTNQLIPKYLAALVTWVNSTDTTGQDATETATRLAKFKSELSNYFDVEYLCSYYIITDLFGAVDQRVKNQMMGFWYNPTKQKMLAYMIFYDNDTIMGVRNDGKLKYDWDIDEETIDPELSANAGKTVYAFAGHDSVLWQNLRSQFQTELMAAYAKIRKYMTNSVIFNMFDTEQSSKFCERIYNIDALKKYIIPKTIGVDVKKGDVITHDHYDFLLSMQGSRLAHRHWWILNRVALFDAKYDTGDYNSIDINWKGSTAANASIKLQFARKFYAEVRKESTEILIHQAVEANTDFSYTNPSETAVGTIYHLFGGAWISILDLSNWGGFQDLTFPSGLNHLTKLILGNSGKTYGLANIGIFATMPMLSYLDITNYITVPTVDLTSCTRLETVIATGCTSLTSISFASGIPLTTLKLPANYRVLNLNSLPLLTRSGITFENIKNISGIIIQNCAKLSGTDLFNEIINTTDNTLTHVRITGVNMKGDGSDLIAWKAKGIGGYDTSGGTTDHCSLVGTYELTSYMDETTLAELQSYYNELTIKQIPYTMIEFDDSVSDPANISNLDNKTGYKYGNSYVVSGHVLAIKNKRHRYLGKKTADGVMAICQLNDADSNYYSDKDNITNCTPAILTGEQGDKFVYEPHYWYKGINDLLNSKKYIAYSYGLESAPTAMNGVKKLKSDCTLEAGYAVYAQSSDTYTTYDAAKVAATGYTVAKISVSGYTQVRFPSIYTAAYGFLFLDNSGNIISRGKPTNTMGLVDGDYLIATVPSGATQLAFTIGSTAVFDYVFLTTSSDIEVMEPDWVEHKAQLVGVSLVTVTNDIPRSVSYATVSTGSGISPTDLTTLLSNRGSGYKMATYEMRKDLANLFCAIYGTRNSQDLFGYRYDNMVGGSITGYTDICGMRDSKPVSKTSTKQGFIYTDKDGIEHSSSVAGFTYTDGAGISRTMYVTDVCMMGYESLWDSDKMELLNPEITQLNTVVTGAARSVKISYNNSGSNFLQRTVHGRYADILPRSTDGSNSTYFCDENYFSSGATYYIWVNTTPAGGGGSTEGQGIFMLKTAWLMPTTDFTGQKTTARIAFDGTINIMDKTNPAAFKAL
jgi:hypothetical protein